MATNEPERQRWNDERWYSVWPKREALTGQVTAYLLAALAPVAGERILDVGCGGGRATLAAAAAVGERGEVVGVDISSGLARLARSRADEAARRNVSFVVADVQTDAIAGAPFDAAMSQFGVMFFDEPLTAFRNIRGQLRPGGRLAFACWQALDRNPWFVANAVSAFVPPPPEPAAGKSATGPFTLADPVRTRELLEQAGFHDVHHAAREFEADAPEDAVVDEVQLSFMGVPDDELPRALDAARAYMSRFRLDGERSRFPLAFQIFAAHA